MEKKHYQRTLKKLGKLKNNLNPFYLFSCNAKELADQLQKLWYKMDDVKFTITSNKIDTTNKCDFNTSLKGIGDIK